MVLTGAVPCFGRLDCYGALVNIADTAERSAIGHLSVRAAVVTDIYTEFRVKSSGSPKSLARVIDRVVDAAEQVEACTAEGHDAVIHFRRCITMGRNGVEQIGRNTRFSSFWPGEDTNQGAGVVRAPVGMPAHIFVLPRELAVLSAEDDWECLRSPHGWTSDWDTCI